MTKRHPDADLIARLGGPAKVAERLRYDKQSGGIQRVQNWMTRGIPAHVKVEYPALFMRGKRRSAPAASAAPGRKTARAG